MAKPNIGDWASAREAVRGDGSDTIRREGVVISKPITKDGYYRLLPPYGEPFDGHVDDIRQVPDNQLTSGQKEFKEDINNRMRND